MAVFSALSTSTDARLSYDPRRSGVMCNCVALLYIRMIHSAVFNLAHSREKIKGYYFS